MSRFGDVAAVWFGTLVVPDFVVFDLVEIPADRHDR